MSFQKFVIIVITFFTHLNSTKKYADFSKKVKKGIDKSDFLWYIILAGVREG